MVRLSNKFYQQLLHDQEQLVTLRAQLSLSELKADQLRKACLCEIRDCSTAKNQTAQAKYELGVIRAERDAALAQNADLRGALKKCRDLTAKWIKAEIAASAERSGAKEQKAAQRAADLFDENITTATAASPEEHTANVQAAALERFAAKFDFPGSLFREVAIAARYEAAQLLGEDPLKEIVIPNA